MTISGLITHASFQLARVLAVTFPLFMLRGSGYADIALSVIAALFLIHSAVSKRWEWAKEDWVAIALLTWLYLVVISLFIDQQQGIEEALSRTAPWGRYPLFAAALGCWLLKDSVARRYGLGVFAASVAFLILDGFYQYHQGVDLLGFPVAPGDNSVRLTGPYTDPKLGIILAWLALPVVLAALFPRSGRSAVSYAAGSMLAAAFLVITLLSGERMAFLLSAAGLVLALMIAPFTPRVKLLLLLIGFISVGAVMAAKPGIMQRQLYSTAQTAMRFDQTPYGQLWHSAWKVAMKDTTLGVGPRQFRRLCPDAAYGSTDNITTRCNLHPHNYYLEWLVETGLVGLSMFLMLIYALARRVASAWPEARHNPIFLGLVITLALRLLPVITNASFFTSWVAMSFWFFVGWLVVLASEQSSRA